MNIRFETEAMVKGKWVTFRLSTDGKLTTGDGIEHPWYKDDRTGKPWIPKKMKTFKSLISQSIRDGDFD